MVMGIVKALPLPGAPVLVAAAFAGTAAFVAAAAVVFAWAAARARFRRDLAATLARWELLQADATPDRLVESFTLGWLNLILRFLWTPIIEKHLAGLAMELLQRSLNEAMEKHAGKAPWKYIALGTVESLSLGLVPPQLQYACVRYDPTRQLLSFAFDVSFTSSGAQGVVLIRLKPIGVLNQGLSGRLEATHLHLSGRMHIGIQFTQEAPGIKGIYYSFARQPDLEVLARPLGSSGLINELLPGIVGAIKTLLARPVRRRLVEPQRRFFDFQRAYRNRHVKQAGGPGGLLEVVLIRGHNILPAEPLGRSTTPSPGPATASLAAYAQLRAGRRVLRTPLVHRTAEPVWQWSFSVPLPSDIGMLRPRDAAITLEVCDAKTIGEPAVLGRAQLKLADLGLEPNGPVKSLTVPLSAARPLAAGNGPTVEVTLQWLQAAPRRPDPFQQAEAREASLANGPLVPSVIPPVVPPAVLSQQQSQPSPLRPPPPPSPPPPPPQQQQQQPAPHLPPPWSPVLDQSWAAGTPSPPRSDASAASLPVLPTGAAGSIQHPSPPPLLGRLSAPASPTGPRGPVRRASTHRRMGSAEAAVAQHSLGPASPPAVPQAGAHTPQRQPEGSRWSMHLRRPKSSSEVPLAAEVQGRALRQSAAVAPSSGAAHSGGSPQPQQTAGGGLLAWFKGRSWKRFETGLAAATSNTASQQQLRQPSTAWAAATPSPIPTEDPPMANSPRVLLHVDSDGRMLVRHTGDEIVGASVAAEDGSGRNGGMWDGWRSGSQQQGPASVSEEAASVSGTSLDGSAWSDGTEARGKGSLAQEQKQQQQRASVLGEKVDNRSGHGEQDSWALRAHPAGSSERLLPLALQHSPAGNRAAWVGSAAAAADGATSGVPVIAAAAGGGNPEHTNPLALLARVAHLQRQLAEQQGAADEAKAQLAAVLRASHDSRS